MPFIWRLFSIRFLEKLNLRTSFLVLHWQQLNGSSPTLCSSGLKFWFFARNPCLLKKAVAPLSRRDWTPQSYHDLSSQCCKNCIWKREAGVNIASDCSTKDVGCQKIVLLTEKWHINALMEYRTSLTSVLPVSVCILPGLGSWITLLGEATLVIPQFKWYGLFNKPFIFHLYTFMPRILQIKFSQHVRSQGT